MGKNKNGGKTTLRKLAAQNSGIKTKDGSSVPKSAPSENRGGPNSPSTDASKNSQNKKTLAGSTTGSSDPPVVIQNSARETPIRPATVIASKTPASTAPTLLRPNLSIPPTKSTLPPPPPDPVFVLRGAASPVTCVQFISPALRLNELSPSQSEALNATYGSPDTDRGKDEASSAKRSHAPPLLKLPPPGFLQPTTHIAAGMQSGQICIWDLKTKVQVACWQAHTYDCAVLALKSVTPTNLVSMGRRDSLKLWHIDLSTTNELETNSCDPAADKEDGSPKNNRVVPICKTQISLGDYLGFASCDVFKQLNCIVAAMPGGPQDAVSVWSVDDRIKICQLRVNETTKVGSVMQLKWVEKRNRVSLLVAYESGDLCLWDWSNRDLHSIACIKGTPVSLEYDQSLGSGILGTTEDGIFIFNISSTLDLTIVREISVTNEGLGCCISRPDSKLYATGGWDNRIRIFSWHKHKPLAVLDYHANSVSCLHYSASRAVSSDGAGPISAGAEHVLTAGSLDGSVSLWKIY
ncbi:guanine nucleotide-binding protein subunit beta-like protein 1 [Hyalella azteca]|uniref:Guanine nucleotide-binding protein subunit beta-like protein 1 n=1 Tax=Hyalella azteca TaxID=294128 RepID=A0A8B7NZ79_HYAAZ|nr:guanine nucleotide-binding protein subunit beta-like protein 1 [Hyalella azteca]